MLFNDLALTLASIPFHPSKFRRYHFVIHFIKHLTEKVFYKDTTSKLKNKIYYNALYHMHFDSVDTIILKHWMEQNIRSEGRVFLSTNYKSTELLQPHLKYFTKVPKILIIMLETKSSRLVTGKINISYIDVVCQILLRVKYFVAVWIFIFIKTSQVVLHFYQNWKYTWFRSRHHELERKSVN